MQETSFKKLKALAFPEQVGICHSKQTPGKKAPLRQGRGFAEYLAVSLLKVVFFFHWAGLRSHTLFLKCIEEV